MSTDSGHTQAWHHYRDGYRRAWEQGNRWVCWLSWELAEHAFRFGWEMAQNPELMALNFMEAEATLRQRWPLYDRRYHQAQIGIPLEHTWNDVHDAIRQGGKQGSGIGVAGAEHRHA